MQNNQSKNKLRTHLYPPESSRNTVVDISEFKGALSDTSISGENIGKR